jgi:hypothetical protein
MEKKKDEKKKKKDTEKKRKKEKPRKSREFCSINLRPYPTSNSPGQPHPTPYTHHIHSCTLYFISTFTAVCFLGFYHISL